MGLNWLITGGCGFIGRNLVKNLVNETGNYIRIVDNLSVGSRADLSQVCQFNEAKISDLSIKADAVDFIEGDILNANLAMEVVSKMDVVVHLAANTGVEPSVEDPRTDCEINVIGTFNYLEASRRNKIKRFVFASSGAPAGEVVPPIHEELAPHPVSPYGASKLAGEGYCSAYYKTYGVETVCLRFGNVYGPLSIHKSSVVAKFINRAINGKSLEIYGDGSQTRDFIFIKDLIRAIRFAQSTPGIGGETFQIATNNETTINEMAELLINVLISEGIAGSAVDYGDKRMGDVMRNFSDTSKAAEVLKWTVEYDLKTGLEETVRYFLDSKSNHV